MSAPDLQILPVASRSVALPWGRVIDLAYVEFTGTGFYYGALDLTPYLTGSQKNAFPGYDPTADNLRASDAARAAAGRPPVADGSTSTLGLFVEGVANDLSPNNPGVANTLVKVIYVVAAVAVAFIVWQIVKAWKG